MKDNPSEMIAKRLDGKEIGGAKVRGVELKEDFYEIPAIAKKLLTDYRPNVIISTGWDFTNKIKVEMVALNVMDSLYRGVKVPDSRGNHPRDEQVIQRAPLAYRSTLPVDEIVAALNEAGIPATYSYHACTHCCNEIMFSFLHYADSLKLGARSGHIHVLPTPEMIANGKNSEQVRAAAASMDLERQTRAIEMAVAVTVRKLKS